MKGQNVIFTLILCFLVGASLQAQEEKAEKNGGLFVRANVGYGFQGTHTVQGVDINRNSSTNIYGSTAPGLNVGAGVGYMFNKHFGVELGAYYTFGTAKVSEVQSEERPLGVQGAGADFAILNAFVFEEYTHRSKQMRITPAIIVKGGNGKIKPYAKVGLVVPVFGTTYTDVKGTLTSTEIPTSIGGISIPGFGSGVSLQGTVDAEAESKGQFSVGFDASLGMEVAVNDMISIFGEVNLVALTIKSKETTVKKYDGVYSLDGSPLSLDDLADGINTVIDGLNLIGLGIEEFGYDGLGLYENIDGVPLSESHFIYVDELNANTNNPAFNDNFNENESLEDLARRDNNSSIGINIGVKFNF